jgi:hypothetical protein
VIDIMTIMYLYGFPVIATLLGCILAIFFIALPPTAKLLLFKKLGLAKGGKGYCMMAYDDRYMSTEAMDVTTEGALEKKKHKTLFTFFLAKPRTDSANPIENQANEERDRDMLPPYFLDGILPVYLGHISKAIATNPKILTALRLANRVKPENPKYMRAEALLPKRLEYIDEVTGEKTVTDSIPIQVVLPYDPIEMKKNFPNYWQQSGIDAAKKRSEAKGYEKAKKEYKEYIWPIVIVAIVCIAAMVLIALATGVIG